ncbi:MAG: sulfatase [Cyclobacteriaceae bacterium]|nr:sulfatase [Cyclobacteriaceae bacterium]
MKAGLWVFISFFLFFSGCAIKDKKNAQKPNVLLIFIDDLNTWIGALGDNPDVKTPNIDRLAQQGLLFANAHCQAPLCGPSRASLFSGLLPSTTGIYGQINDADLRKDNERMQDVLFLPEYFAAQGYKTLGAGKLFHQGDKAGIFQDYGNLFSYGPNPPERLKFNPVWYGLPTGTQTDWGIFPEHDQDMPDHQIANWAAGKLQENFDDPFFMAVGFIRPHVPWYTTKQWFDLFNPNNIALPPYKPDDFDDLPSIAREIMEVPMMPTTEWLMEQGELVNVIHAYLACIAFVDHQVGKVLDALSQSKYANNTMVVLISDHGYHLGEKNRFAKHSLWERSTHIPMIFKGPGIPANRRSHAATGLIDVFPTLIEYCHLPEKPELEGRSLLPLVKDPEAPWPYAAITTYGQNNHSVVYGNWHYIRYEDSSEELYEWNSDPHEWNNLASDLRYQSKKMELRKHLPVINRNEAPGSANKVNAWFRQKYQ